MASPIRVTFAQKQRTQRQFPSPSFPSACTRLCGSFQSNAASCSIAETGRLLIRSFSPTGRRAWRAKGGQQPPIHIQPTKTSWLNHQRLNPPRRVWSCKPRPLAQTRCSRNGRRCDDAPDPKPAIRDPGLTPGPSNACMQSASVGAGEQQRAPAPTNSVDE